MKKLILLFSILLFNLSIQAQVNMNLRIRITDTLVVDKYKQKDTGFKMQQLFMAPGSHRIKNERAAELLKNETVVAVDLVYSDYKFKVGLKDNDFVKGKLTQLR